MPVHTKRPEEQYLTQPKMPRDRPATKQEIWEWTVHMYGGVFELPKLQKLAQDAWAWSYVRAVNKEGWKKQPDWLPGDPIVAEAVPPGPFPPEASGFVHVNKLWAIAQAALPQEGDE